MADIPVQTCFFFVDDSNIWIEAQKAAAAGIMCPKLEDRDRDPRFRINIGKLLKTLVNGRVQGPLALFGSRPPPNDSVWAAFKRYGFDVKIFERNLQNKEKEVDTEMTADIVEAATDLRKDAERGDNAMKAKKASAVFVIISGDRDMISGIRKALKAEIRVEVWSWKHSMAREYYQLQKDNAALLTVYHLDQVASKVFFTNYKSTRTGKPDPATTVVCSLGEDPETDEDAIACALLGRVPYIFFTRMNETGTVLFVEFPHAPSIDTMVARVRAMFRDMCKVLSYPEYANTVTALPIMVETMNVYTPLAQDDNQQPIDDSTVSRQARQSEDSKGSAWKTIESGFAEALRIEDDGGWETVTRSDRASEHHRRQRHMQPCHAGIRCSKGGNCGYQHSAKEQDIFRDNPTRNMSLWKSQHCQYGPRQCPRGDKCPYAHSSQEAWCRDCKVEGHCRGDPSCTFQATFG